VCGAKRLTLSVCGAKRLTLSVSLLAPHINYYASRDSRREQQTPETLLAAMQELALSSAATPEAFEPVRVMLSASPTAAPAPVGRAAAAAANIHVAREADATATTTLADMALSAKLERQRAARGLGPWLPKAVLFSRLETVCPSKFWEKVLVLRRKLPGSAGRVRLEFAPRARGVAGPG
jgi:hypothetical protein